MTTLHLYLGEDYLGHLTVDLVRGRECWSFTFAAEALNPARPLLDPAIANVSGPQFAPQGRLFGCLADISPDRWGRKLIRRREQRPLRESDYLLGVCDLTRQGALRLKREKEGPFIAPAGADAVPPWTTLRELEAAAKALDADEPSALDERHLQALLNPGSSLGGARPKANVAALDGSLWIAKFPSLKDGWDVGLREFETSRLARAVGLQVPETQALKLSKAGTTFFSKRFDRRGQHRIPYASAMTMLGAQDGEEDHAYLEIAEFIAANSADATADLQELWRRMVFSEVVGNTDDHLRNHGFLLTPRGWRLAPMFDVNPNPDPGPSALDRGDLFSDIDYYRISEAEANRFYRDLKAARA